MPDTHFGTPIPDRRLVAVTEPDAQQPAFSGPAAERADTDRERLGRELGREHLGPPASLGLLSGKPRFSVPTVASLDLRVECLLSAKGQSHEKPRR